MKYKFGLIVVGRTLTAKVQILPEKTMPDPLDGAVPSSHRRFYAADVLKVERGSSENDEASVKTYKVCSIFAC